MTRLSAKRRERAEDTLATVRIAQADFWKSLSDLESCLGIELESTVDFRDTELKTLLASNK